MDNKTRIEEAAMRAVTPVVLVAAMGIDTYRRKILPVIKKNINK